ncbi:hypothetical protein EMIHUDRAFT_464407 [Emiliania huxleyi CCMP1516]|uniref:Protein kinase domain-containing protein n=2 Tax=Emiliania huxleyi TaxID=2903 RepID=A0A0D3IXQ0_EMIH1|nr:hypothetical protein EMIHUDRAFT_464407 [Emiliania huxleyi CCMP1516]EOD16035.1 hypothetical protein EMIHUDRAFT_464407 [Emiliania huxleyi CCMP1516]|eukprot:XP_005768464.1 hypothetical protein EMIHUDRAFT_464407 [Emiliania huxleyi CCMP1516]
MDPSTTNPLTIAGLTATAVLSLLLAALLASLRWGGTYSALRLASEAAFLEEHDRRIDAVVAHDVARRYKLGRRVGSGATSDVFRVTERVTGEAFALKRIGVRGEPSLLRAVEHEVALLRRVRHRHVVGLHESFASPTRVWAVLEMVSGGDLSSHVSRAKGWTEGEAGRCLHQVLSGLAYLHANGIAHRDIKLPNLLLSSRSAEFVVKITDLGAATAAKTPYAWNELSDAAVRFLQALLCTQPRRRASAWEALAHPFLHSRLRTADSGPLPAEGKQPPDARGSSPLALAQQARRRRTDAIAKEHGGAAAEPGDGGAARPPPPTADDELAEGSAVSTAIFDVDPRVCLDMAGEEECAAVASTTLSAVEEVSSRLTGSEPSPRTPATPASAGGRGGGAGARRPAGRHSGGSAGGGRFPAAARRSEGSADPSPLLPRESRGSEASDVESQVVGLGRGAVEAPLPVSPRRSSSSPTTPRLMV